MVWFRKYSSALFGILLLIWYLPSCKDKSAVPTPKAVPPAIVDVLVASPQTIGHHIEVNGTVVANEFVSLQPEASGRLTYLDVPEGKKISAGTIIAVVNNADLKAQLAKTKTLLELAEKTEERYRQLLAINGINQSDYDAALNVVKGYRADAEYTQALIDKTILKAPFDGIVGLRQVSLGAYVTSSTVIATMQQLEKIKIDFTLPEEYSEIVKIGGTVEVEPDASSKTRRRAVIIAIEPEVNQSSRNLTVRAILQEGKANPGGYVKVYLDAGVDARAIMVPTNSLIPDDKNNQVILVKDGKAVFVNVKTGLRQSNNVEITSGINPGDTVIVTGVLFARPKAQVQVRSAKTLEQFAALNNNFNNAD